MNGYLDKFLTWISLHLPKEALNALRKIQFTIGTNFWNTLYIYLLFRESLSERMCAQQSQKVMWDCSWHRSRRTYFCCFPLAFTNIRPWPLMPFNLSNFFEEQWTQNHPQYLSGLSCALIPTTFLEIAMWCIERLNNLNTLTEHNESTSTWFGLTEHVTPNKLRGPHIPPRQVPKQYVASRLELTKCSWGQEGSISDYAVVVFCPLLDIVAPGWQWLSLGLRV